MKICVELVISTQFASDISLKKVSNAFFSLILGAFTVTRELYPLGFYLVIIAKTDDMICQTPLKSITGLGDSFPVIFDRVKDIELNIVRKITQQDYVIAVLGALGMFMAFYFTVFMISCCLCIKEWHMGSLDEDRRPIISSIEVQDVGKDFDTHFVLDFSKINKVSILGVVAL